MYILFYYYLDFARGEVAWASVFRAFTGVSTRGMSVVGCVSCLLSCQVYRGSEVYNYKVTVV